MLLTAHRLGCRFDGWSDQFRFDLWKQAFNASGIGVDDDISPPAVREDPLAWDHIDSRVTKDYLWQEWKSALVELDTQDCRRGDCQNCGACDFKEIKPRLYDCSETNDTQPTTLRARVAAGFKTVEVVYEKKGPARFFGHLEMVNIFFRALRRSKIHIERTQGYHPKPKVAFSNPLPIGMEGLAERFVLRMAAPTTPPVLKERLNSSLPEGLRVVECREVKSGSRRLSEKKAVYQVRAWRDVFDAFKILEFKSKTVAEVTRTRRPGKVKQLDLKKYVADMKLLGGDFLQLELVKQDETTVRPAEVISSVFGLTQDEITKLIITKL